MTIYHDPRAELDYNDFHPVSDNQPVKYIARGVDADFLGPNPRQTPFAVGEKEAFQAVRDRLDRALQATRVIPSTPQEFQTPEMYEASLLGELAKHSTRLARTEFSKQLPPEEVIATCIKHNVVADALTEPVRQNRLAEIVTRDATGREIREYVGAKSSWMNPLKGPVLASPIHIDGEPQRV